MIGLIALTLAFEGLYKRKKDAQVVKLCTLTFCKTSGAIRLFSMS